MEISLSLTRKVHSAIFMNNSSDNSKDKKGRKFLRIGCTSFGVICVLLVAAIALFLRTQTNVGEQGEWNEFSYNLKYEEDGKIKTKKTTIKVKVSEAYYTAGNELLKVASASGFDDLSPSEKVRLKASNLLLVIWQAQNIEKTPLALSAENKAIEDSNGNLFLFFLGVSTVLIQPTEQSGSWVVYTIPQNLTLADTKWGIYDEIDRKLRYKINLSPIKISAQKFNDKMDNIERGSSANVQETEDEEETEENDIIIGVWETTVDDKKWKLELVSSMCDENENCDSDADGCVRAYISSSEGDFWGCKCSEDFVPEGYEQEIMSEPSPYSVEIDNEEFYAKFFFGKLRGKKTWISMRYEEEIPFNMAEWNQIE